MTCTHLKGISWWIFHLGIYLCNHHWDKKLHFLPLKALNLFLSSPNPREPPSWFLSSRMVLPVPGFHVNGATQYTPFCLVSFSQGYMSHPSMLPWLVGLWYIHCSVVFLCVHIPPLIRSTFCGRLCMSQVLGRKLLGTFSSTSMGGGNTLLHVFGWM